MTTPQSRLSLPELRRKTDRELVILAGKEIERSLCFEGQGAIAAADAASRQAWLLLRLSGAPPSQISEMEAKLDRERARLSRLGSVSRACGASC
jgi:hypothetical protein